MVSISLKRRLAFFSIFILLFLSLSGGSKGMVLCVLPGGHVEFESMLEGCCDKAGVEKATNSAQYSTSNAPELNNCGPCVDIPLSGIESCVNTGHGPGLSKSMPPDKITYRELPGHWTIEAPFAGARHHKSQRLASVRSVTLRI